MSRLNSRALTLAVLAPVLVTFGCVNGPTDDKTDTDPDVTNDDTVDTDVADTDIADTGALDTDILDTDVVDTDLLDTDVEDTDAEDSADSADTAAPWDTGLDTGEDTGSWWDTGFDTGLDTADSGAWWDTGLDTSDTGTTVVPTSGEILFVTDAGTMGDFGGVAAADALCNASPVKPDSATYKAVLVDGSARVACSTSYCGGGAGENVDWALAPNTGYFRPDGTYIGTTNAQGLFDRLLINAVGLVNSEVWTGLNSDWTTSSTCSAWTDSTSFGEVGLADELGTDAIDAYLQFCDRTNVLLYCASQAPPARVIYTTQAQPNGDLGGVAGADAACNTAPPVAGVYKALIVDGVSRVACTSDDCQTGGTAEHVDWVLEPSSLYVRADGTEIGTTNFDGLFLFDLANAISPVSSETWTGLSTTWTVGTTCDAWTDGTSSTIGTAGLSGEIEVDAISAYEQWCDRTNVALVCVQQ